MASPLIKICGIRTAPALDATLAARADYVGFNFYPPSPRFVSLAEAAALGARARGRAIRVGVFVDPDDATLGDTLATGALDAVQLHGGETPGRCAEMRARHGLPVWKVLPVAAQADVERAERYVGAADLVLFDARTPKGTLPGGMGLVFDWSLLKAWKGVLPWGLAGGLSPANVAEAVRLTKAPMVDAASGIETAPGEKDPALIAAFCAAARGA